MATIPRITQRRVATFLEGEKKKQSANVVSDSPGDPQAAWTRTIAEIVRYRKLRISKEREGKRERRKGARGREESIGGGLSLPRLSAASFHELLPTRGFVSLPGGRGILLLTYRSSPTQPREPLAHV